MSEINQNPPATVPSQPEAKPPLKKGMPVVIALVAIIALIGIANVSSLVSGNKKSAPTSALPMRPAAPSAQQVSSFETQQQMQARRDAEERQHQQELAAAIQQLQAEQSVPGPEVAGTQPMTSVPHCCGPESRARQSAGIVFAIRLQRICVRQEWTSKRRRSFCAMPIRG